jgi:Fic family protein
MIVYNLSIKVLPEIEKDWISWLQQEHIPEVMASGQFTDNKIYRLLNHNEDDGSTFVIQYFAPSIDHYNKYIEEFASLLREKSIDRWGEKFIAFRTIMEPVN